MCPVAAVPLILISSSEAIAGPHGPHLKSRLSEDRRPLQTRGRGRVQKLLRGGGGGRCTRSSEAASRQQTSPLGEIAVGGLKVRRLGLPKEARLQLLPRGSAPEHAEEACIWVSTHVPAAPGSSEPGLAHGQTPAPVWGRPDLQGQQRSRLGNLCGRDEGTRLDSSSSVQIPTKSFGILRICCAWEHNTRSFFHRAMEELEHNFLSDAVKSLS